MSLAPSALLQLDSACELFSKAAPGFRAVKVLVSSVSEDDITQLDVTTENHASAATESPL